MVSQEVVDIELTIYFQGRENYFDSKYLPIYFVFVLYAKDCYIEVRTHSEELFMGQWGIRA